MPKDDQDVNWGRYLGIVIGRFLDRRYGWEPWGTFACVMLGLAAGMYLLIKEGMRANKD